jgi:hypothetical protein
MGCIGLGPWGNNTKHYSLITAHGKDEGKYDNTDSRCDARHFMSLTRVGYGYKINTRAVKTARAGFIQTTCQGALQVHG